MALSVDQFVNTWNNRLINNGGIQCVAVANQYEHDVVEGGWIGTPLTGWATDWWTNFGNDSDYNNYIRVYPNQATQKGDLAIWNKLGGVGLPHIALVLGDNGNGTLRCFSQNPGNARIMNLTKVGIVGYLRPKKFVSAAPTPAPAAQGGKSNETVAAEVARGDWGNNPERKARLQAAGYNYDAIQAIVNGGVAAPAPAPAPAPAAAYNVGDVVVPTALVDYDGTGLTQYDDTYTITEVIGDRAVLSARGQVWAAMNIANIRRA